MHLNTNICKAKKAALMYKCASPMPVEKLYCINLYIYIVFGLDLFIYLHCILSFMRFLRMIFYMIINWENILL